LIGPPIPNPMSDRLELVLASRRFALYRIQKQSPGSKATP
jgi:hypothetical protein